MCISRETMEGLRFTGDLHNVSPSSLHPTIFVVKSLVELTRYLLSHLGVQYFLSEKLTQDPLESFFGRQRMRGGYNENPNVQSFLYGSNSLRVQGSAALKVIRGNCKRGRSSSSMPVDHAPLPKRKRYVKCKSSKRKR